MFYKNPRIEKMHKRNKTGAYAPHAVLARRYLLAAILLLVATLLLVPTRAVQQDVSRETINTSTIPSVEYLSTLDVIGGTEEPYTSLQAHVTGYNTVEWQTDSTPCISATGDDICGRTDVVACPRSLELGTEVEIDGKRYICLDRTAKKYDGRFDISCDKDMDCPAQVTGWKEVRVYE